MSRASRTFLLLALLAPSGCTTLEPGNLCNCDGGGRDAGQVVDAGPPFDAGPPTLGVIHAAAGRHHTCAITADRTVWCWGANAAQQLGVVGPQTSPVAVNLSAFTGGGHVPEEVCAGVAYSCVRFDAGEVVCWGDSTEGQTGTINTTPQGPRIVPVGAAVTGRPNQLRCGPLHACVVTMDNQLACWGSNVNKRIDGDLPDMPPLGPTRIQLDAVYAVSPGAGHTCAIADEGSRFNGVFCWGANDVGQAANSAMTTLLVPTAVTTISGPLEIAAGNDYSCAIGSDGPVCWGGGMAPDVLEVPSVPIELMEPGGLHVCARHITATNTVECWGEASSNRLGPGLTSPQSLVPMPGQTVLGVTAGLAHSCAWTQRGIACWGLNDFGQVSPGEPPIVMDPSRVPLPPPP